MKIISKHRDYYDSIAHQKGIDPLITYIRETKELYFDNKKKYKSYFHSIKFPYYNSRIYAHDRNEINVYLIGFCGKFYEVAQYYENEIVTYIYGIDQIKEKFESLLGNPKLFTKSEMSYYIKSFGHLEEIKRNKDVNELFYKCNTPCFLIKNKKYSDFNLIINPVLENLEFYKIKSPFEAFQEIEMFISGVLGNNGKETITISDKDKIVSHGFDYKKSFRKEKE